MLLPTDHTAVRRSLSNWFDSKRIHPVVNGEFDDSALLFHFRQSGAGIFPAPSVVEDQVRRAFNVRLVGRTRDVRERFYAITVEERRKHPAAVAVREVARRELART